MRGHLYEFEAGAGADGFGISTFTELVVPVPGRGLFAK